MNKYIYLIIYLILIALNKFKVVSDLYTIMILIMFGFYALLIELEDNKKE